MPNDTHTDHQPHPSTPGLRRYQMTPTLITNPTQIHVGFTDAKCTQAYHQPHPSTPGLHRYQMTLKLNINPAQVHLGFTAAK